MKEDLFADIPVEGKEETDSLLEEKETETPEESQTQTTETEESPSQEGEKESEEAPKDNTPDEQVPFHKHPRWMELQEERKQLREQVEELSRFKEETAPKLAQLREQEQPVPDWFVDTYGDNPDVWNKFQSWDKTRREQIKQEIFEESQKAYAEEQSQNQKYVEWATKEVQSLRDDGLQFDENELAKVIREYMPTNAQGTIDVRKAYDILEKINAVKQLEKTKVVEKKKQVAAQTMEGSQTEQRARNYATPKDLRNKSWSDLAV